MSDANESLQPLAIATDGTRTIVLPSMADGAFVEIRNDGKETIWVMPPVSDGPRQLTKIANPTGRADLDRYFCPIHGEISSTRMTMSTVVPPRRLVLCFECLMDFAKTQRLPYLEKTGEEVKEIRT